MQSQSLTTLCTVCGHVHTACMILAATNAASCWLGSRSGLPYASLAMVSCGWCRGNVSPGMERRKDAPQG
jgi:hypothetical protein